MNNSKIKFNPVQCTSEVFQTLNPTEGFLYFVTDTKQLFLAKDNEFINMCGGLNIHYGIKEIEYVNNGNAPDPKVLFQIDELEFKEYPLPNDLILNVDGCFYRVDEVAVDGIETTRVTLQGGGGPNFGGGNVTTSDYGLAMDPRTNNFSSKADNMFVYFKATSQTPLDTYFTRISFTLGAPEDSQHEAFYVQEGVFNIGTTATPVRYEFDLKPYAHLFKSTGTTVYINTTDVYGVSRSERFSVAVFDLAVTEKVPTIFKSNEDLYTYTCGLSGPKSGLSNAQIVASIFTAGNLDSPVIEPQYFTVNSTEMASQKSCALDFSKLSHGVYTLQIRLEGTITGTNTVLTSNILTHEFIRFSSEVASSLFAISTSKKVQQYTNSPLYLMLGSREENKEYGIEIKLNGAVYQTLTITTNTLISYPLYFETQGIHNLEVVVVELSNLKYIVPIEVVEYTDNLPIIDPSDPTLMLYLNPKGQSNDAQDPYAWKDETGQYTARLSESTHFSANSGWLYDDQDVPYLHLTSGAQLEVEEFVPFENDPTVLKEGNSKMGHGMTIELDFAIDNVTDYNAELIKCLSMNINDTNQVGFRITGKSVQFFSAQKNGFGNAGSLLNLSLVENKRIRLSIVIEPNDNDHPYPMCLGYINGILSSASYYASSDTFKDAGDGAKLKIDSTSGQIKIYSIKFYSTALQDQKILNNFTASLPTLTERQDRYDSNNIYSGLDIDFEQVSAENYDLQIPYMTIVGGWKTENSSNGDKWKLMTTKDQPTNPGLPEDKKDYRMIDVSVVYPKYKAAIRDEITQEILEPEKNLEFKDYQDFSYTNVFSNGGSIADNFGQTPINKTGCIMYAQGTSSMEYPIKNLRLRFRNKEHYFTVDPDIAPVSIICMKADYMESSGSHNTGAATLIDDLYEGIGLATPGQEKFGPTEDEPDRKKIVTCIKGHPCLIFYSPTGAKGSFKYVGKYNLNLDKATPEPFGFNHDDNDNDFGYLSPNDNYWAVQYKDGDDIFIGQEKPSDGGDYADTKSGEEELRVQEGQKINSIHCFEFLDNAVSVCNFLNKQTNKKDYEIDSSQPEEAFLYFPAENITKKIYDEAEGNFYLKDGNTYKPATGEFDSSIQYYTQHYSFKDTWYRTFKNKDGDLVPGWALGFESRYPEDRIGYHDADMLYPLAKWLNELYLLRLEEEEQGKSPLNITYNYQFDRAISYQPEISYYVKDEESPDGYSEIYISDENEFNNHECYTRKTLNSRFEMDCLERFKREYQGYLNKDFLVFYYVVTEALLMADSRVKNMMIATWGKNSSPYEYQDLNNNPQTIDSHIFYPIFYDMDTMLGLDNTGVNRFNYYDEDTNASIYNGEEVLWNFVRDTLFNEIDKMYQDLESAGLNTNKTESGEYEGKSILPYFDKQQAKMANEAFYNGDAQYKYIKPAVEGYYDGLNKVAIKAGEAPYLYAAQGDRSLMREYFITNRIKFLRGKHSSQNFRNQDRVTFRLYCPSGNENEFIGHENSITYVPPTTGFDFESLQSCYAGVLIGANGSVKKERFNGAERKTIQIPEASAANGTEAYLLGVSNLKDLGNLANKYPQKFILSGDNKLQRLKLGDSHKYYYNPYWQPDSQGTSTNSIPIALSGCKDLREFDLQNCSTYNAELNFSNSPNIERILLTGSGTTSLTLPVNGNITELRLPPTILSLNINNHPLTDEKFSIGTYCYGEGQNRIEEENKGGYYENDYSYLQSISIINTSIDTYTMIQQATGLVNYYLEGVNWNITEGENGDISHHSQYLPLELDVPWESNKYYLWNAATKQYELITDKAVFDSKRGFVKKLCPMVQNGEIVCIPILDYLLTKTAKKDNVEIDAKKALSGTIFINISKKANEFVLYEKYREAYPNITISYGDKVDLTQAYTIEFFNTPKITDKSEPYYKVLTDGNYYINELISRFGPAKSDLEPPTLMPENDTVYNFTNTWKDEQNNEYKMTIENNIFKFVNDFKPKSNLKLIPVYESTTRFYSVKFFTHKNQANDYIEVKNEYGQKLGDNLNTPLYLARPDDDSLPSIYHRYTFKGWISKQDFDNLGKNTNPTIIDIENLEVKSDNLVFYPYYIIEDARTAPMDLKYFDIITNLQYRYDYSEVDPDHPNTLKDRSTMIENQLGIRIKNKYAPHLSGKITLPNTDNNGNYFTVFTRTPNGALYTINELYFLSGHKYLAFGEYRGSLSDGLLQNSNNLKKIYFPPDQTSTLKYFGKVCLKEALNLTTIENFPQSIEVFGEECFAGTVFELNELPDSTLHLCSGAFRKSKVTVTKIPKEIKVLPPYVFYLCDNVNVTQIGRDTSGDSILGALDNDVTYIGHSAFYGYTYTRPGNLLGTTGTLIFEKSVTYIYNNKVQGTNGPFNLYGPPSGSTLRVEDRTVDGLIDNASAEVLEFIFGRKPNEIDITRPTA